MTKCKNCNHPMIKHPASKTGYRHSNYLMNNKKTSYFPSFTNKCYHCGCNKPEVG